MKHVIGQVLAKETRNWKLQHNNNIQEFLPDSIECVELDCATHTEQAATQLQCHSWKTKKLDSQETEQTILLKGWLSSFLFVCDLLHCTDSTKG
jgi:hypothetical protein